MLEERLNNGKTVPDVPKKLIIFYGMMKSGNHAVIKWVFENALRQYISEDEIQTRMLGYIENARVGNVVAFYNDVILNPISSNYMIPCEITIVSIEEIYSELPVMNNVKWDSIHKIFLFRDLKNMISSRKFCREYRENYFGDVTEMCNRYKLLVNAYNNCSEPKIKVSYDNLVKNGDSELIEKLGIVSIGRRLRFDQVPRIISQVHKPGWSSFPGDINFNDRHKKLTRDDSALIDKFIELNPDVTNLFNN